jgi:transposase
MEVVQERCCGLDIHKKLIVACTVLPGERGQPRKQVRSFGAMSDDLQGLSNWLAEQSMTHVAMEAPRATGSRSTTCCRNVSNFCSSTHSI